MREFIKIVFISLFMAIFILPNDTYAHFSHSHCVISSLNSKTTLINDKKEEYHIIENRKDFLVNGSSNKKDNIVLSDFDRPNINLNINFIAENSISLAFLNCNIFKNLKHIIYARAP